ncbi:hypothetical protein DICPUDRAFT_150175 [Dictyostelium purpureum]|uniref:Poly(A) polymerase n=1 Tax=Dictyostelium purpureum TaxID=5786 RepID=F0ZFM8_DICPU|nr:uncharacterized protein DICPUDRAFT_150175 [Dictyostelium purpureum]EGC37259.1 hypothetical protein DICPUDRAFT_150175 [Dictyostelium purpureum]|eukprot:XP_003286229.1 hypothetical protein DICPUDRAFT_150175 [Dictyostelium purpureum]
MKTNGETENNVVSPTIGSTISSPLPASLSIANVKSPTAPNGGTVVLGVTEPISTSPPSALDLKLSNDLENTLISFNLFESPEESRKREEVLGKLNQIVREWAKQVSIKKGYPEQTAAEVVAKIFTFGSYRLGVHGPNSDIDTLCVGPKHIMRSDFFDDLSESLKTHPEITEFTTVKDAFVPVINMVFSGVPIDLIYARLSLTAIPEELNDLIDEGYLKNVDEKSILSLNGCRVADQILKLVPNIPNFRMALRCIKLWAISFLGGITWALLTARICQLYPNSAPSTIINRFFKVYENWKWPAPVLLTHLVEGGALAAKVWNAKRDKAHLMPILTPAYPMMNSTYNVSKSTMQLLKNEFVRGAEITRKIETNESTYNALLEKSDFFTRYRFYIQIDCSAGNEEDHRKWEGWIESKLRFLISNLEMTPKMKYAVPFPKSFSNLIHKESHPDQICTTFFMGLVFNFPTTPGADKSVDLTKAVSEFTSTIKEWLRTQPNPETMADIKVQYIKKKQLPSFIQSEIPPAEPKVNKKRVSTGDPSTSKKKVKSTTTTTTSTNTSPSTLTPTKESSNNTSGTNPLSPNNTISSPNNESTITSNDSTATITNDNSENLITTGGDTIASTTVNNETTITEQNQTITKIVNTMEVNELDFISNQTESQPRAPPKKPNISIIRG